MAAEANHGALWGSGFGADDQVGPWQWVRAHRLYCTGVAAIVVATLFGANWASQPRMSISSTPTPSVAVEAPAAPSD